MAIAATPPTTPPAIAPVLLDFDPGVAEVGPGDGVDWVVLVLLVVSVGAVSDDRKARNDQ